MMGYRIPSNEIRYSIRNIRYSVLRNRYSIPGTGFWMLDAQYWISDPESGIKNQISRIKNQLFKKYSKIILIGKLLKDCFLLHITNNKLRTTINKFARS